MITMAAPFLFSPDMTRTTMNYWVTNIAGRDRLGGNRAKAQGRVGRLIWLCDGRVRLVRGRPQSLGESLAKTHWNELRAKSEAKLIKVQEGGPMGPMVDFGGNVQKSPAPPVPPTPPPPPEPVQGDFEQWEDEKTKLVESDDKPLEKMSKAELVTFLAEVSGLPEDELNSYTKKQLLDQAPDMLAERDKVK